MSIIGVPETMANISGEHESVRFRAKWHCGCQLSGSAPFMIWDACNSHAGASARGDEASPSASTFRSPERAHIGDDIATWSFDPINAYAAKELREQYTAILAACSTPDSDLFAAELIYRELVSNALRHAPGQVIVELQWSESYPILSVHDQSGLFFWSGSLPRNPLHEHGRGLFLVHAMARSLHIKNIVGQGFKISAVLPVERRPSLAKLSQVSDVRRSFDR